MIPIVIKKNKYLIGIFIVIFFSTIGIWSFYSKENIYLLYSGEIYNCKQIDEYEKNKYPFCNNGKYLFERKAEEPVITIDDLKTVRLTSIEYFFKDLNYINKNIFLIIKEQNKYKVIPVKLIQVLS